MRIVVILAVMASLVTAGVFIYNSPRVRALWQSKAKRTEDPLAFLKEESGSARGGEAQRKRSRQRSSMKRSRSSSVPSELETPGTATPSSPAPPEVPNSEVSNVLLGVLRARGLAEGIVLTVSDDVLAVSGEVDSPDQKEQIIEILNKGRGQRRLDAVNLLVEGTG